MNDPTTWPDPDADRANALRVSTITVADLRAWADDPCASGYVPIFPATLRRIADQLAAALKRASEAEALIDAAKMWAFCPAAGSYRDGPSTEDTCEALSEAVGEYFGIDDSTLLPPDQWWSVDEMQAKLDAAQARGAADE